MPLNNAKKSVFDRPPAAPIFRPSLKEFIDPLEYIDKIRPIAQKFGICKIVSPKQWNPPFAIDEKTFKFRPRVQRLKEVGAHARIRHNFLRSIEAYWDFQGPPLVVPVIRNITIDPFELYSKVRSYGGSQQVSKNKQWTMVCRELGMGEKAKFVSSQVKSSYDKLIQPYLDFCDNKFMEENKELFPEDVCSGRMRGKTAMTLESPKMTRSKTQKIKKQLSEACNECKSIEYKNTMVTCVECDLKFHIDCLNPSLSDVIRPWTCFRCLQINCARELSRLDAEVFGFSQSHCKYSLESFATYADNFKKTYFKGRQNVSIKEVEEEYWRLIAAENDNEDIVVKYGADISSGETSSGFPTKLNCHLFSENDQQYVENGWNLNNLPILNKSIFRFVSNDISGMTVPWCYVGMMFSCFCWHIEDHWSYSINFMHTGECKTWYGVPESDAELFEDLMRKEAGQLFKKSPDLLHHITTQINPTILLKNNIKVYRTDQAPGEFVVTFPRAYHAGFNQGFNFAEAVNFCPADWLNKGRQSVESYRLVKRPTVFSHNELICKMALSIDSLDIVLLKSVYDEVVIIQQEEKVFRKLLSTLGQGNCRTERLKLDDITEDERECLYCRTTLFMSGVTCNICCKNDRMVCLDHVKQICKCSSLDNIVLKYRFSLDEISAMVANVKNKLEQYNLWMTRVYHLAKSEFCSSPMSTEEGRVMKNISQFIENLGLLDENNFSVRCVEEKPNLEELKMLLQLGRKMNCPELLLDFLEAIIDTCQRAMTMTDQLLKSHKLKIGKGDAEDDKENVKDEKDSLIISCESQRDKLTLKEMKMLVDKLRSLPAHVPQLEEAAQALDVINDWRRKVKSVVSTNRVVEGNVLIDLLDSGESNLVYLSEYTMIQRMKRYVLWIGEALKSMSSFCTLSQVKKIREEGEGLVNIVEIDRIATVIEPLDWDDEEDGHYDELMDYRIMGWRIVIDNLKKCETQLSVIITLGETMQRYADNILKFTPGKVKLSALKTLLDNAESKLKCSVPGIERLKEVEKEAEVVNRNINEIWHKLQQNRRLVHVEEMQTLIKQCNGLCVSFEYLADIKSINDTVESWKVNLQNIFIKPSHNTHPTSTSLLDVLFPRPTRMFKMMIARESVSSKLVASCKAESTLKKEKEIVKDDVESLDDDKTRISRKSRGRQKRASFSSDDPMIACKDNVSVFETFLKTKMTLSLSEEVRPFSDAYKNMCVDELEWMWNLRELNEDKASKDSNGHDVYCFCRKRGSDQKGSQVMCDLCQDWFHLTCLGIQSSKDMSKKKFLCPLCERSKRPLFEVILAERKRLEQEARMLIIPEHIVLCLMSQRVTSFHKHTNQLFSPQTELGAVFAEYKKLFGVHAILPKYQQQQSPPVQDYCQQHSFDPGSFLHTLSTGKQSRKTPHLSNIPCKSSLPPATISAQLSPVPSKDTLMNIQRLKVSLSEDARRELEEIYIELCLLEVNLPTVTWIWKLYHSLIDDDDDEEDSIDNKPQKVTERMSDYSDNGESDKSRLHGSIASKLSKRLLLSSVADMYTKVEPLDPHEKERKEALQKFSFKRKLASKSLIKSPIKKQQTLNSIPKGVVTRKRGRGGKNAGGFREIWEGNRGNISSEYYDEENDEILLDNVEINVQESTKAAKKKSTSLAVNDTKSLFDDNHSTLSLPSKHITTTTSKGRQHRQCYMKQFQGDKSDDNDFSDDYSPSSHLASYDDVQAAPSTTKRGRKPTVISNKDVSTVASSSSMKRRRRGGGRGNSNNKRVCNDDCEADECVQQSSDKVNWIACDECNLWYHWICVDIRNEMEIGDRFLCPRCNQSQRQSSRVPIFRDRETLLNVEQILRDRMLPSLADDDGLEGDLDNDDLNVTMDDEEEHSLESPKVPIFSRISSLSSTIVPNDVAQRHSDHYFRESLSPLPPFLQPECGVQEEVVEISYVSRSDSD